MKRALEYTEQDFRHIIGANLESPYHLCQIAYPLLKASGKGSIVFISSVAGTMGLPVLSVYSVSKSKSCFFFFLGEIERAIFEYFWFRNKIFHLGFLKSQFSVLFKKLGLSIQIPIFNLILISKSQNFIFPPRFSQKFQFDMHLIL